ncbi:class E sortase [Kitasatospora sp. A2-31]|uniref:class E sortase n=1 Tax=Kitasatospora sp. A2-31 TaxID=2916414 RepID=UPI001EECF0DF|nr:class E sortase [Kitasatospora sp. A2-31]MCG6494677.1 class E sortase [Kitasatospora sp. A2-31]
MRPEGRFQPGADPLGGGGYGRDGAYGQAGQPGEYDQYDQYGQYGQAVHEGRSAQGARSARGAQDGGHPQQQEHRQGRHAADNAYLQHGQYQYQEQYAGYPAQQEQPTGPVQQGQAAQRPGRGADDGWGVYEQAEQPLRAGPDDTAAAAEQPDASWPADRTIQLRVPPPAVDEPPTGGRAERRRAAQGRMSVRSGSGRRRANGRAAAGERGARPKESALVVGARFVGEFCITLGVVMLLFVSYQLWWTNVQADAAADGARNQLEQQFDSAQPAPGASGQPAPDPAKPETFEPGKGFAIIHLPKLGLKFPIAEGTAKTSVLDKGLVGHYTGTGMPADKQGNFALAAHRNTHGEPFRHINQLGKGDKIVVETATSYYTYEVTGGIPETPPSNVSVIKPVPNGSGFTQPGRYITLTTCTPEFSSKARLILFGKMIEERPRSQGKPPALTAG